MIPYLPPTAPLELRLPAEVYAMDGLGQDAGKTIVFGPWIMAGFGVLAGILIYKLVWEPRVIRKLREEIA